jgi:thiamine biosynthesis lipoprotein
MGVSWTITLFAATPEQAAAAIAAAYAEVARLEAILSDYDPASELSRLSALAPTASPQVVGPDLWRVLNRAVAIRDATAGAFDPTVGPLTSLWRQSRRSGHLPLPQKLAAARAAVGTDALVLVPDRRAVSLTRAGMRLDLGGIGMGYAVDRAMEVLTRHGIAAAMIDGSGDIAVSAAPPGTSGWTIAIAPLAGSPPIASESLLLANAAVTTSGDAFQAVEIDGVRYSHIVDPLTGLGVVGRDRDRPRLHNGRRPGHGGQRPWAAAGPAGSLHHTGLLRPVRLVRGWQGDRSPEPGMAPELTRQKRPCFANLPAFHHSGATLTIHPSLRVGGPIPTLLSLRPGA